MWSCNPGVSSDSRTVRLLGTGASGIDRSALKQGLLFDGEERGKQVRLDEVVDNVQDSFGRHAVERASGLLRRKRDGKVANYLHPLTFLQSFLIDAQCAQRHLRFDDKNAHCALSRGT